MIVVSDSSPLRALHYLGLLHLCHDLYGSVIVPGAVRDELRKPTSRCPALEVSDWPGFQVRDPNPGLTEARVPSDLDSGEAQAISLAIELHADLVLMDERKGTVAARSLGLSTIGVLGVLLDAKRKGMIDQILPLVDRLMADLRFFVTPALRKQLAKLANE